MKFNQSRSLEQEIILNFDHSLSFTGMEVDKMWFHCTGLECNGVRFFVRFQRGEFIGSTYEDLTKLAETQHRKDIRAYTPS